MFNICKLSCLLTSDAKLYHFCNAIANLLCYVTYVLEPHIYAFTQELEKCQNQQ